MNLLHRLFPAGHFVIGLLFLTSALALGQTILEEEVQREAHMSAPTQEAPQQLPYVASVGMTAAALLAAWGVFIWFNRAAEQLEPQSMQAAVGEDRKIEKAAKGDEKR